MAIQLSVYVLYNSSHWKASRSSSAVTGRQKKKEQKIVIMRMQSCCFAYSNRRFFDVPVTVAVVVWLNSVVSGYAATCRHIAT